MNAEQAKKLREPFPDSSIGQLPRKTKDGRTIYLSYVGHAAVTDRLLQVDPDWTWEPIGVDERGLPALDVKGGLWIRLMVCGVTRLGYGHGDTGLEPGDDVKKAIGDALRNAAMRFGVALDLWAKEDLKSSGEPSGHPSDTAPSPFDGPPAAGQPPESSGDEAHTNSLRSRSPSTSPETAQEPGNSVTPESGPVSPDTPAPEAVVELGASGAKALADALGGQKNALDLARDNWPGITSLRKLTTAQASELLEIVGVPA